METRKTKLGVDVTVRLFTRCKYRRLWLISDDREVGVSRRRGRQLLSIRILFEVEHEAPI